MGARPIWRRSNGRQAHWNSKICPGAVRSREGLCRCGAGIAASDGAQPGRSSSQDRDALLPDDVRVVLQFNGLAERERHRRRAQAQLHAEDRLPHRIEAELISALGMGTNLDVAAADQSRPSATRAAKLIHPMRSIFIPYLGKIGLAYFLPSECEVAHTSRGINVGSGGHQTPTGPAPPQPWPLARYFGPTLLGRT